MSMPNWDATTWTAVYGAVLSTLTALAALGWWGYSFSKNQPRLLIRAGMIRQMGSPFIEMKVSNIGRRPVTIVGFELQGARGKNVVVPSEAVFNYKDLPITLSESEQARILLSPSYVLPIEEIRLILAKDSAGLTHKSAKLPLKNQINLAPVNEKLFF